MPGRHKNRRGGKAGRGKSNESAGSKTAKKKSIEDYCFYVGSSKQASDYELTAEFPINHVKKTFVRGNDISEAPRNLEEPDVDLWKTSLKTSTKTDAAEAARENEQFKMEHKADLDEHMKRKQVCNDNKHKAHALIWERRAKAMQHRIESRKDCESDVCNDPIKLLKAVKEHALNYQETRYAMTIILDAFRAVFNCKQKEGESLQDHTRRFKTAKEILESHVGGPVVLPKHVKTMDEHDENNETLTETLIHQAFERLMTCTCLENSDSEKHGSIIKDLNTQKSLGNDQCPKTLTEANNAMSDHKFDNPKPKQKAGNRNRNNNNSNKDDKGEGEAEPLKLGFAQMEGRCHCCGKEGHCSNKCRKKNDIPKEDWAIKKAQMHTQAEKKSQEDENTDASKTSTISSKSSANKSKKTAHVGWAGVHVQMAHMPKMKEMILLDSCTTDTMFCNPDCVANARDAPKPLELGANGGLMTAKQECDMPHIGESWCNPNSIANTMGLAHLANNYRVTCDSGVERAFLVHLPDRVVRFVELDSGLHAVDPNDPDNHVVRDDIGDDMPSLHALNNAAARTKRSEPRIQLAQLVNEANVGEQRLQLVETVAENLSCLSQRDKQRVKEARRFYQAMGTPSIEDLKAMTRVNLIANNPITTEAVNLSEKVCGPDIGTIKGKTTRSRPKVAVNNDIEIPKELVKLNKNVTLSMDGLCVNELQFLTAVSHNLCYRAAQCVPKANAIHHAERMDELIDMHNRGGFVIAEIHCDNEFHSVMDNCAAKQDPPIVMNYAAANEHVGRAERNNRVIQERVRANYHNIPFDHLPRILVKAMVTESARKINGYPSKHGVSEHCSPRMIVHKRNLDYEPHCKCMLGEHVLGHDEPPRANANAPRALDCLHLRPSNNRQGSHELLHLQTNAIVTRRMAAPAPITPSVIKQVHRIAEKDKMPKGLKIRNRFGEALFDSSWIAGVDHDQDDDFADEDHADSESEDDEDDGNDEDDDDDDDDSVPGYALRNQQDEESSGDEEEEDTFDGCDTDDSDDDYLEMDDMDPNEALAILNYAGFERDEEEQEDKSEDEGEIEIAFERDEDADPNDDDEDESHKLSDEDDISLEADEEQEDNPGLRRTERVRYPPRRFQHVQTKSKQIEEHSNENGRLIGAVMTHLNELMAGMNNKQALSFVQTYGLKQGIKKFGERGIKAAHEEMKQLHDRVVFEPAHVESLTKPETKRAMESLIFLAEKRDGTIKARTCANGSVQRACIPREEATSPAAATQAIIIAGVIDAKQHRDVMTVDIPNAFVQTAIPSEPDDEKIIVKIRGQLVEILCDIAPEVHKHYVVGEGNKKTLCVRMLKALCGMLVASILCYKKFRKDIEAVGFVVNPCDICVANRIVRGKQHAITWHVDDAKSSHVDKRVNDDFYQWCEDTYGSEELGHVKCVRGHKHDYLAVIMDCSAPGKLKLNMECYVDGMIDEFPCDVKSVTNKPWTERLFKVDPASPKVDEKRKGLFHTFAMKCVFLCKRARLDATPAIGFLALRVEEPNEGDWKKLVNALSFLKGTKKDVLTLEADDNQNLHWFVDASFAVHADMKSHAGAVFSLGMGTIDGDSTKQKVNSRSSAEAELTAVDDKTSKILWAKRFIEHQGFKINMNLLCQDNASTIKLEENGKASSGKRARHFDIKLFCVTDLCEKKEVTIKCCPTDDMVADCMSKPLVGAKFKKFRQDIMNLGDEQRSLCLSMLRLASRSVLDDIENEQVGKQGSTAEFSDG